MRTLCNTLTMFTGLALIAVIHGMPAYAAQGPASKMDLNSAPEASLMEIPGINKPMAKRIIANRPYATTNELEKAGIRSPAILDKIAAWVVQPYVATPTPKVSNTGGPSGGDFGTINGRR